MSKNAQWNVEGSLKGSANHVGVYLASADLSNVKEAHKRARTEAMRRWKRDGVDVDPKSLRSRCVG